MAEEFSNVQFLGPFQRFETTLISTADQIAQSLQKIWPTQPYFFYLNFTNIDETDFKMDWLLKDTKGIEISSTPKDLVKIKNYV